MMMKQITMMMAFLATLTISMQATAESVTSLRGIQDIEQESTAPAAKKYAKDNEPITRDYVQQPPLIPHKIDHYQINLKSNKCMSCHSWSNYRKSGATKISQTHFESRDKHVLAMYLLAVISAPSVTCHR